MAEKTPSTWRSRALASALALALTGAATFAGAPAALAAGARGHATISRGTQSEPVTDTTFEQARVSYLGPVGTYTQEAAQRVFGPGCELVPVKTVSDAADALAAGEVDFCVIPQENTIGGPVTDYADVVIGHEGLSIAAEVELPISQNLLARPGTRLEDITQVYSHKQGISQGGAWVREHIPSAEIVEASSTAEGARIASEEGDGTYAAICSAGCAEVYGLEILARDIQQNSANVTRFYVLTKDAPANGAGDRMVFVAEGPSSALPSLMSRIDELGMTLVSCHDRPAKTELGRYRYLIEVAGPKAGSFKALSTVPGFSWRNLGTFSLR